LSWVSGVGLTAYGHHAGSSTLDLMSAAASEALADANLERRHIDGLITGYSTTFPHLMLSSTFSEHFGLNPHYAHAVQLGGATGFAMVMLAHELVEAGVATNVLVVAGENRATGQSRDSAMQALAQVGHPTYEVPFGATIPAYYALIASRYMHEYGVSEADFAALAVLMRRNAGRHPGAQFRDPITIEDVLASREIATPLKLLDCCPVSDGGCAVVVSREPTRSGDAARIRGAGQAHLFQHVSAAPDLTSCGAADSAKRALANARISLGDVTCTAIYDSFTVTLTMLLEEIGICKRGEAGARAAAGEFDIDGQMPLNMHGGLLSYGHCGVGGAMAHLVEIQLQMTGRAGQRQIKNPSMALLHGDGGTLSSHISLIMEQSS